MTVSDLLKEQDECKAHCHEFTLWRRKWQEYSCVFFLDWRIHRLDDCERHAIPEESGIYTLLVQPGIANHPASSYLMYVGQTTSLRRRFGEYLNRERRETGRPKIMRLLNLYATNTWFCYSAVPQKDLDEVEGALLTAYIPPANDQLPASIRGVIGALR